MAKKLDLDRRSRSHNMILYLEDDAHRNAIDLIRNSSYTYAGILHDSDINDDGTEKKEHYHFVITFNDARTRSAISKELGIEKNYIEPCDSLDRSLEYLLHLNDNKKYQYDIEDIEGSLKKRLYELMSKKTKSEVEKVSDIIDFIRSYPADRKLTVTELTSYCVNCGLWSEYRRSAAIFFRLLEERNLYLNKEWYYEIAKGVWRYFEAKYIIKAWFLLIIMIKY